jgi:cytidine deaminase
MNYNELAKKAVDAKEKSFANFSNFHVGAALLTENDELYLGANIENSSYSLTICAERTAVFQAVLDGHRKFKAVAIASDFEDYCPPCGACRQVLMDLCGKDLDVVMVNKKDEILVHKLAELLPLGFNEDYLK